MIEQGCQESPARLTPIRGGVAVRPQPRLDEWADQPRPDGALVVDRVAACRVTLVAGTVARFACVEGPQSERRQQPALDLGYDASRPGTLEQRDGKTSNGEDLIRTERIVAGSGNVIDIDDISEVSAGVVPESLDERRATALERVVPAFVGLRGYGERVQPQRLDFDRLADARSNHSISNPRVHPGQLHPGAAGHQQSVGVEPDPEPRPRSIAPDDR